MLQTEALEKIYMVGVEAVPVLKGINIAIRRGSFVVLCGPSGSGKTTVLNLLSGLDSVSGGKIFVAGQDLTGGDE